MPGYTFLDQPPFIDAVVTTISRTPIPPKVADHVIELEQTVERVDRKKQTILKQRADLDTLQTDVEEEQTWRE